MRVHPAAWLSAALAVTPVVGTQAQVRASERGMVSQTIDGTTLTVDYARPQVRGRDSVFGKVVHRGEVWTPGANWATTFELSRAARLNGQEVAAGKYSVWMVPQGDSWTIHLHPHARRFHTQRPALGDMAYSIPARAEAGEHVEVLTFDFPRVGRDQATLRLRWGTVAVNLAVGVTPSRTLAGMTDEALAPYLGSYTVVFIGDQGSSPEMKVELVNARGKLRAILDGPEPMEMEFIPTGKPHEFLPAFMDKGEILDVEETPLIFEVVRGRAVGFTSALGDEVWLRGKRR